MTVCALDVQFPFLIIFISPAGTLFHNGHEYPELGYLPLCDIIFMVTSCLGIWFWQSIGDIMSMSTTIRSYAYEWQEFLLAFSPMPDLWPNPDTNPGCPFMDPKGPDAISASHTVVNDAAISWDSAESRHQAASIPDYSNWHKR